MNQLISNRVLDSEYTQSRNFFKSDLVLQDYLQRHLSSDGFKYMSDKLERLGAEAACKMDQLSLNADKYEPKLVERNFLGEDIDEIRFHPDYDKLLEIALESEMFTVKWKPELRNRFVGETHLLGFAAGYLYSLSEMGQYCPLCMTDGVARLIDLYADEATKNRLLPRIYTKEHSRFYSGAMFLTEKSGGSDVGRNVVTAKKEKESSYYLLNGEKWFCSNANAELIFVLARTDAEKAGTRGLSIFLVEKYLEDTSRNPLNIVRLKEKLGVRSMASAEIILTDTKGTLVGNEFEGFKLMTEMINLSRLYNSVAALSAARRALIEAFTFLKYRWSFDKKAISHPLIRHKLHELGCLHIANFYLTWRTIKALDAADNGDENEKELSRLLTPMTKKWSAEKAVYITRESMELMGGMGYIEDGVLPKIMRDVMVLPIWEGAGNIMVLDMLRASIKSRGLDRMLSDIAETVNIGSQWDKVIENQLIFIRNGINKMMSLDNELQQLKAKNLFENLTTLYQLSLIVKETNDTNRIWMEPASDYLAGLLRGEESTNLLTTDEVEALIGWDNEL